MALAPIRKRNAAVALLAFERRDCAASRNMRQLQSSRGVATATIHTSRRHGTLRLSRKFTRIDGESCPSGPTLGGDGPHWRTVVPVLRAGSARLGSGPGAVRSHAKLTQNWQLQSIRMAA
jgi:hypothetical protein